MRASVWLSFYNPVSNSNPSDVCLYIPPLYRDKADEISRIFNRKTITELSQLSVDYKTSVNRDNPNE